jgi:hypothetical protein
MTPIPPIPWDMPSSERQFYEGVSQKPPEERTPAEHMCKRYVDLCLDLIQTRDTLIERIAKLTAEVERLQDSRFKLAVAHTEDQLAIERLNKELEGPRIHRLRNEELERENTRLKAPVSDEELTPHCLGTKYFLTEVFDKVIASRATRTPPQEG